LLRLTKTKEEKTQTRKNFFSLTAVISSHNLAV